MTSKDSHTQSGYDQKLEVKLNVNDLECLKEAFSLSGSGYNNKLSLNKDQFVETCMLILDRGSRQEYVELFEKVDITAEGVVDWDKISSHLVLDYCERDERNNSFSIPQWKDLKTLHSPHKDCIQRILRLKNFGRYLTVSKEGLVAMFGLDLHLQRTGKVTTDTCKQRDLWVADAVIMPNVNKIAFALTSKEILFSNINLKMELVTPMKLSSLPASPICMDYWYNHNNHNEALLIWGDTEGIIHLIFWHMAQTVLFERPPNIPAEKEDLTISVIYSTIMKKSEAARIFKFKAHADWVRQVRYIPHLDCLISCATVWSNSLSIAWLEKQTPSTESGQQDDTQIPVVTHISGFSVHQGINAFDYHEASSLIATAGVNFHVCLWNPYVTSKPNGMLRGHMAPVVAVQFETSRQRLLSFSKDNVIRIWDTQLQVSIQKIAGVFPKGLDDENSDLRIQVYNKIYFHEAKGRLFIAFNSTLTVLEMKPEQRDRVYTHESPTVGAIFNSTFNQVVTVCQTGTISYWLVETGQRIKNLLKCHKNAEITCLTQDPTETRFYTGSTDGTVKVWDMNGCCHHTLVCFMYALTDVTQVVVLKRAVIVIGSSKHFTVFKMTNFTDHYVYPSDWKGQPKHKDDVMAGCALPPHGLITGSYDGELIVWNTNSDLVSRRMTQRCKTTADLYSDFLYNVSCLTLLTTRKNIGSGSTVGANLISCGGNGVVRFWNAYACILIGEFTAHEKVSSIIMAVDQANSMLATADIDGNVKLWNIASYCLTEGEEQSLKPPPLISQWAAHSDLISGIAFCSRQDKKTVIVTASSDCSVCLWSLEGSRIGVFGQEERWKLDGFQKEMTSGSGFSSETTQEHPILPTASVDSDNDDDESRTCDDNPFTTLIGKDFTFGIADILSGGSVHDEDYLNRIKNDLIVWDKTILGKEYRQIRLSKPQRRQPAIISDLPFLYGEKYGRPNYGPYYSVATNPIVKNVELEIPDFVFRPEKYFTSREDFAGASALLVHSKLPLVEQWVHRQVNSSSSIVPKNPYDEKSFFPNYLLEFEQHMQRVNKYVAENKVGTKLSNTPKLPNISQNNWNVSRNRQSLCKHACQPKN